MQNTQVVQNQAKVRQSDCVALLLPTSVFSEFNDSSYDPILIQLKMRCLAANDTDGNCGIDCDLLMPNFKNSPVTKGHFCTEMRIPFYMRNFSHFKQKTWSKFFAVI